MKYTTKIKQAQKVAGIHIDPKGGDLNEEQVKKIVGDKYGKELIDKKLLIVGGTEQKDPPPPGTGSK